MSQPRADITSLVLEALAEHNALPGDPVDASGGPNTVLYGRSGTLDSLALVRLVVAIEGLVEERLGRTVILTDERALAQERSPFATVGSLVAYVEALLQEPPP